ncbi:hypothetical protein [Halohasta salina]|uniref:hypothetical protein n=1 Tax=Halohasta salina TaxID=2961621 RepID=UPI0020A39977|nr:hypothetical protein [Halohasta salina]
MSESDDALPGRVDEYSGDSDMVTFERVSVPEPAVRIEQVGEDPDIRYRYEWDERGEPTPEQFERVTNLEVKLAVMMNDLDGEVLEQAHTVLDELAELQRVMCGERDLDSVQEQQVLMGNIDGLPEVESR